EQTKQPEQPVPEQPLPSPTNNNNQIYDKAIAKFNCLKEAYSALYKQNQSLIQEKEY
ncbi:8249_t:CDS:1, partial [Racocetra persica]